MDLHMERGIQTIAMEEEVQMLGTTIQAIQVQDLLVGREDLLVIIVE